MHFLRAFAFAVVLVVLAGASRRAAAQDYGAAALTAPVSVPGRELPPRSTREIAGNWLMIGGGALLVAGWGTNAPAGFGAGWGCSGGGGGVGFSWGGGSCQHDADWEEFRLWSYAPVIGPWAQLALLPEGGRDNAWTGWLVASAVVQTTGLALLIAGLVTRLGMPDPTEDKPSSFAVTPSVSPDGASLTLTSSF
jgi:hypothetical protein